MQREEGIAVECGSPPYKYLSITVTWYSLESCYFQGWGGMGFPSDLAYARNRHTHITHWQCSNFTYCKLFLFVTAVPQPSSKETRKGTCGIIPPHLKQIVLSASRFVWELPAWQRAPCELYFIAEQGVFNWASLIQVWPAICYLAVAWRSWACQSDFKAFQRAMCSCCFG